MTASQLQKLLDRAGISQRFAAKCLDINERTMRKYVAGDAPIPGVVEIAIHCLAEHQANDLVRSLMHVKRRADSEK